MSYTINNNTLPTYVIYGLSIQLCLSKQRPIDEIRQVSAWLWVCCIVWDTMSASQGFETSNHAVNGAYWLVRVHVNVETLWVPYSEWICHTRVHPLQEQTISNTNLSWLLRIIQYQHGQTRALFAGVFYTLQGHSSHDSDVASPRKVLPRRWTVPSQSCRQHQQQCQWRWSECSCTAATRGPCHREEEAVPHIQARKLEKLTWCLAPFQGRKDPR